MLINVSVTIHKRLCTAVLWENISLVSMNHHCMILILYDTGTNAVGMRGGLLTSEMMLSRKTVTLHWNENKKYAKVCNKFRYFITCVCNDCLTSTAPLRSDSDSKLRLNTSK